MRAQICLILAVAVAAGGCAATTSKNVSGGLFAPRRSLLVGVAADSGFESAGSAQGGSGYRATTALMGSLAQHFERLNRLRRAKSEAVGVAAAKHRGYDYYLHPVIENWEDRATEWNGRPDRIRLRLSLTEVSTGRRRIDVVAARSSWLGFVAHRPEELLSGAVAAYVEGLGRLGSQPRQAPDLSWGWSRADHAEGVQSPAAPQR